jgi:predicted kinase
VLIVFGGLPGSGKTTLSRAIAQELHAAWLRVDLIEAALWRAKIAQDQPTGLGAYSVAFALAEVHLHMSTPTVVDAVNPIEAPRQGWRDLAASVGVPLYVIEVVCSDPAEQRHRVETRVSDMPGFEYPSWQELMSRDYEPWTEPRLTLDTATVSFEDCLDRIRTYALL